MKGILIILLSVFVATCCKAQQFETVKTVNNGTVPSVYTSNKLYYEKNYDSLGHLIYEGLKFNNCFLGTIRYYWQDGMLKEIRKFLVDTPGAADLKRWSWLKNFRVWEANRKVFQYPENWIESDLPVDRTPYLKELENRGRCNIPDGEWETYDKSGKLISKKRFDKGKKVGGF